jgi:hypothetical protein
MPMEVMTGNEVISTTASGTSSENSVGDKLNHAVFLKMPTLLYWPTVLRGQRQTQINAGGANNVVLVIVELVPLSLDGFISDHTLMSGDQKAEDGRCALER